MTPQEFFTQPWYIQLSFTVLPFVVGYFMGKIFHLVTKKGLRK